MQTKSLLTRIVSEPQLHARWLNSLSFLENTGARKISASQHKFEVSLMILKHAAEEARHAYYLKKQIEKIEGVACPDYTKPYLLVPNTSYSYLNVLDVRVCRYLKKELGLSANELKFAAYLLVTYAIEIRADLLYPIYQEVLTEHASRVTVKSIILEEEGHLEEMKTQLELFSPEWEQYAKWACEEETALFEKWLTDLEATL